MKTFFCLLIVCPGLVFAKLPPPSDEAKAAQVLASAKTSYAAKVDAFALCKAQDRVALRLRAEKKASSPVPTPACADPGVFVPPAVAPVPLAQNASTASNSSAK